MKLRLLLLSLLLTFTLSAQIVDETTDEEEDIFSELEDGGLVLRFTNALTGKPINDAIVNVNNEKEYETDFKGRIKIQLEEENGVFPLKFEHPEYITTELEFEIMAGTIWANQFSISPVLPMGTIRIVLDWGPKPKDLDLHLVKKESYHISYRKMKSASDNSAWLDRDDLTGYGPETITVKDVDERAEYVCYVKDFSNQSDKSSTELSESGANIKIYGEQNRLLEQIRLPGNMGGIFWKVFTIERGQIKVYSQILETLN